MSKLSPVSVLSGNSDGGSSEKGRDKKEGANSKAGGDAKAVGSSMSSLGDLPFLNSGSLTSAPNSKPGVWCGDVVRCVCVDCWRERAPGLRRFSQLDR